MGSVALFVPHVGCPQQCSFCDQRAITGGVQPPTPWQVWETAQAAASHLGEQVKETEIAFFGGSFTAIPRGQMLSLLAPAKEAVERFGFRGLRCSTRPDAVDGEVLSLLKAYHMVAVELGAQSMDGEVLRRNRRGHSPEDTVRAAGLIRAAGLELGLQMMTGLYGSTPEKDVETARALIALRPATARDLPHGGAGGHPSCRRCTGRGTIHPQTLEEAVALCARLLPLFEEAGVRVIRVGLHAQEDVERRRVAGPYHPAFRELVESRRFLARLLPELEKQPPAPMRCGCAPGSCPWPRGRSAATWRPWPGGAMRCALRRGRLPGPRALRGGAPGNEKRERGTGAMILKSLELQGFKTFPDKTTLQFERGITSVVGPNGSGKSNISDAMRWVLGEQSVRTLRCSKMEDVIFNGTPQRKALGFAEVTLTIDNRDRGLPFDNDTVAVTRRYYRSGESEYLINKNTVRLKDINELFMDTGLGRDGYSIIGQGKIDSIVAARSEDRREIFEEAAGISRYRYRKEESERRLGKAEENLVRLRDILSELEGRVEPLRIQAEKAEQFIALDKEKKELEIGIWLETLERSGKVLREHGEKISLAQAQHGELEEEIQLLWASGPRRTTARPTSAPSSWRRPGPRPPPWTSRPSGPRARRACWKTTPPTPGRASSAWRARWRRPPAPARTWTGKSTRSARRPPRRSGRSRRAVTSCLPLPSGWRSCAGAPTRPPSQMEQAALELAQYNASLAEQRIALSSTQSATAEIRLRAGAVEDSVQPGPGALGRRPAGGRPAGGAAGAGPAGGGRPGERRAGLRAALGGPPPAGPGRPGAVEPADPGRGRAAAPGQAAGGLGAQPGGLCPKREAGDEGGRPGDALRGVRAGVPAAENPPGIRRGLGDGVGRLHAARGGGDGAGRQKRHPPPQAAGLGPGHLFAPVHHPGERVQRPGD